MNEITKSKSYRIYSYKKTFDTFFIKILKNIFYLLAIFSLLILVNNFLTFIILPNISISFLMFILAGGLLLLTLDIFIHYFTFDISKDVNNKTLIFDYFSDEAMELIFYHLKLCKKYKISTDNLSVLVFALNYTTKGKYFLVRSGIILNEEIEKQLIGQLIQSEDDQKGLVQKTNIFLENTKKIAQSKKQKNILLEDLVLALYDNNLFFGHLCQELNLQKTDLEKILDWTRTIISYGEKKYFWQQDYFVAGIGRDWASGYTPMLNLFSVDLSQYLLGSHLEYQSKASSSIISEIEDVLAKSGRNNVLLVGENGVGKKTIVNCLTQKIIRGNSYKELNFKHVTELDVPKILSGARNQGEIQARFKQIFDEVVRAGNIILYINNFANLVDAYSNEIGTIDASQFIFPYLESNQVQIIATMTISDYKNKLQANTNLDALFNQIEVKEMKKEEILPGLEELITFIEYKHHTMFSYKAITDLLNLADRYIHNKPFPQKAVDLLTEIGIKAEKDNIGFIDSAYINNYISQKTKIPVGNVKYEEKTKLLNLEKILHKRVIGQSEAIVAISNALRRSRANLSGGKRPIGSFLFIGPTGVGKTETAKAIAEAYYGSEKNMVRFDMSEFQEISTIDRLIGHQVGREFFPGRLTQAVTNDPYTLVLFDEIEKAHPNILNLFLQILDEGKITDAGGNEVDFTNTIIICTSNAGSEQIRQYVNKNLYSEEMGKVIIDYLLSKGIFRPEFINRFDKVVCFKPLTINEVIEVSKLLIMQMNKNLSEKRIKIILTPGALEKLAKIGYDPVFGARALRRIVQEKIEDIIAKKIISEEIKEGKEVTISENEL